MSHTSSIDYAKRAKQGFVLGALLFTVGVLGEVLGHAVLGGLPAWEETLLFDAEVLGVLIGLIVPLVFGIVLPLTE